MTLRPRYYSNFKKEKWKWQKREWLTGCSAKGEENRSG